MNTKRPSMFLGLCFSMAFATWGGALATGGKALPERGYHLVVEVEPVDIGPRPWDEMPAALDLDFSSEAFAALNLTGPVDIDSIQVFPYDPRENRLLPGAPWVYARRKGEVPSRFLGGSFPWDFPIPSKPFASPASCPTYPRGGYFANVVVAGQRGKLVWNHRQRGNRPSYYLICFDVLAPGSVARVPRQGFVGDGSPRRVPQASPLTGTLNSALATDDWDGDGLTDIVFGSGFGYLLLFRNRGTLSEPKYPTGEYLFDTEGRLIDAGYMSNPEIADFDGDGVNDLLIGHTGGKVIWYKNIGTNSDRRLVPRGHVQADGAMIITPVRPNPEAPHYKADYAPGVEAVDWDGDGDTDLILGGYITGYLWYYENIGREADGTPKLTFRGPLKTDGKPIDTIWGAKPCAVDIDEDGDLDLLSGCYGKSAGGSNIDMPYLLYYENTGDRSHPKLTRSKLDYVDGEPRAKKNLNVCAQPRPLDFNGDGLTDLIVGDFVSVRLLQNVGTAQAPRWKMRLLEAPWGLAKFCAREVAVGQITSQLIDFNNDGRWDVVTAPRDSEAPPLLFLNRDSGTEGVFGPPLPILPPGQNIRHPAPYGDPWNYTYLYDFDGDGDDDLLWADHPGYAYLHENTGTNQDRRYDTKGLQLMTVSGTPIRVGPEPVPLDKVEDFTRMQGSRAGIAAADFNEDGLTDIVMSDVFVYVYYFLNQGDNRNPVFADGVKVGNAGHRAKVMVCDMDADGWPDLLCSPAKLVWFRNLGPHPGRLFGPAQTLKLPPTMYHSPLVMAVDWNRDGDLDFLLQNPHYPWLCWLDGSYVKHGYPPTRIMRIQPADVKNRRTMTSHHPAPDETGASRRPLNGVKGK